MPSLTRTIKIEKKEFGTLTVVPRVNCRRIIMRRTKDGVAFSVPYGIQSETVEPIIIKMLRDHIDSLQPEAIYSRNQVIKTSFGDIRFTSGTRFSGVECLRRADGYELSIHPSLDITSRPTMLSIGRVLKKLGKYLVTAHVIDEGIRIASEIGEGPDSWTVSGGRRTFGTCRRRGDATEISLSYTMAFLPPELRRYVVCHELAHLREMNHSPRFHALCNAYCGGKEAELSRSLRDYPLPFL